MISPCDVATFPPEFQLACACMRVAPNSDALRNQAKLFTHVDWGKFVELLDRHRVAPLVAHNLRQHVAGAIPSNILEALSNQFRRNALNTMRGLALNARLAKWFSVAGIPFLPLKGVTLAQAYYGDPYLRQVHDADVWVPPERLDEAVALLVNGGFRPIDDFQPATGRKNEINRERFLRWYRHDTVWVSPQGDILELHWKLSDYSDVPRIRPLDLLGQAETSVGDIALPLMPPEPLLLYLCHHGSNHGWYRLKWLADLPILIKSREWDWAKILEQSEAANCRASFLIGLALTRDLFAWSPPEVVDRALSKEAHLGDWLGVVRAGLISPTACLEGDGGTLDLRFKAKIFLYRLNLNHSLAAIRRELAMRFLTLPDLKTVRLPDRLFPLYFVLRPLLWLIRYWARLTSPFSKAFAKLIKS